MGWIAVILLALSLAASSADAGAGDGGAESAVRSFDARWSHVRAPKGGVPLSIGRPGAGCVQGAVALPLRGPGWVVARPKRHREFGHPSLIAYVRKLADQARRQHLGLLTVGDLGQPRGGPTPSGHRSHQTGLDVDLWYGPGGRALSSDRTRGTRALLPAVVIDPRTNMMTPVWTRRVERLIKAAASNPAVDRIFVHPAVKRALCEDRVLRGPWLMRVRPWWGHHDHFHVRLRCPDDSPDCEVPSPLPDGDGCDTLKWWFSADARKTATNRGAAGRNAPNVPERCEDVLGPKN